MKKNPPVNAFWLHRYAQLTAAMTFVLLIAGGLVTSHDAGLAVPDWPLSYGTLFPPMVGGIRYEHSHRMIAALVGLMIAALTSWLWRDESRRWVRRLGITAAIGVVLQALLGGLTVLLVLPAPISIAHACLGQLVFAAVVSIAVVTASGWSQQRLNDHRLFRFSMLLMGLVIVQLLLGAVIRHSGLATFWHILGASTVLVTMAAMLWHVTRRDNTNQIKGMAVAEGVAIVGQIALGLFVAASGAHAGLATLHVGLGAFILGGACWLAWSSSGGIHMESRVLARQANDYLQLTKPRLILLALFATLAGFLMGASGPTDWRILFLTLLGAGLVGAGGNALNQWAERDADALMRRTQSRPLPAGRLAPRRALLFGLASAASGVGILAVGVNALCGLLACVTLISYVLVYTPLKRTTALCTLVGAIPGALPPLIGWAAASGRLGFEAWILFAMLFLWQLPHFLAIAWLYRDEYAKAGFQMLPVIDPEGRMTARQILLYGAALVPISLLPTLLQITGPLYFAGAIFGGLWFFAAAVAAARHRSQALARRLFSASIAYLPLVLLLMVLDRTTL